MWKYLMGIVATFVLVGAIKVMAGYQWIKSWDKDRDEKLSWTEAQSSGWNRGLFLLKDMDRDGFVDETDAEAFSKWTEKPVLNSEILSVMDVNADGQLQSGEGWWWSEQDFSKFDKNSDGTLDSKELARISKPRDAKLLKVQISKQKMQPQNSKRS